MDRQNKPTVIKLAKDLNHGNNAEKDPVMASVVEGHSGEPTQPVDDDDMDVATAAPVSYNMSTDALANYGLLMSDSTSREVKEEILKNNPDLREIFNNMIGKHNSIVQNSRATKRPLEDNSKFQIPLKAAKPAKVITKSIIPSVTIQNRFSNLNPEVILTGNPTPSTSQEQNVPPANTEPKIKPIVLLKTDNYQQLLNTIGKEANKQFSAKPAGQFIKLFPKNSKAHRDISRYVQENHIEGYILGNGIIRPLKVVVRGLPVYMTPENIQRELEESGFDVIKVAQMTRFKTQKLMPLYQVQLQNNDKNKEIFNVTSINYFDVTIEYYKSPISVAQCHNCQFYHHSSLNCYLRPRCVKCGEEHASKECNKIPNPETNKIDNPKCCNCGGPHPASYRGCPKFPRTRQQIIANQQASRPNVNYATQQTVRPNFSYANAVNNQQTSNANVVQQTQQPPTNLFNSNSPQFIATNNPLFVPPKATVEQNTTQESNFSEIKSFAQAIKDFKESIKMFNLKKLVPKIIEITMKVNAKEDAADKMMVLINELPSILVADE